MQENRIPLSKLSSVALTLLRKYSRVGMIGVVTLFSVVASLLAVLFFVFFIYPQWIQDLKEIVVATVAVPLLIAPIVTGAFATLLMELDRAHNRVVELSCTDSLTGCLNRRGFFDQAERHLHTFSNASQCLIGMIDMDNFKTINDTHGHKVGDDVLMELSRLLKATLKNLGIVGRLGGDEYAIVAFGERSEMETLEKEVQDVIGAFTFGEHHTASASLGGVILDPTESIGEALVRADEALYKTKSIRKSIVRKAA